MCSFLGENNHAKKDGTIYFPFCYFRYTIRSLQWSVIFSNVCYFHDNIKNIEQNKLIPSESMHLFCIHTKDSYSRPIFLTSLISLPSAFSYLLLLVYVEWIVTLLRNDLHKSYCSWQKLSMSLCVFVIIYSTDDNQVETMPFQIPQSIVVEITIVVVFFIFNHAASQRSHHKRPGTEQNYKGIRASWRSSEHSEEKKTKAIWARHKISKVDKYLMRSKWPETC